MNTPLELTLYVALGVCSGFLSGLLGIGGGAVIVPVLIFTLPLIGIDGPSLAKIAVATSLAVVVPTTISSARSHLSRKAVEWRVLASMAPGVIAGALAGAVIAANVSAVLVVLMFVMFLLYSAWKLADLTQKARARELSPMPGAINLGVKGLGVGAISTLVGVAGGLITVPLLSAYFARQRAVGTSSALGVPISFAGVIGYLLLSTPPECTAHCVGYVYWPAALAIAAPAVLMAPIGAKAAHAMPVLTLKRVFAVLLTLVALNLAYKVLPLAMWIHAAAAWANAVAG
ncbi:MAG: sulfite exporter TauE/SafE family protein [Alphaproteobacteria bacterium]